MLRLLPTWIKPVFLLLGALLLTACIDGRDLDQGPVPLGDFNLVHNIVVAPNLTQGPLSREASKEEWIAAVTDAVEARFGRYDGDRNYHFGISLEGYVLAQVGVPLVLQPKSVLIFRITVWDDAAGGKLNETPKEITVLEAISAESVAGSGLTQTREEQLENLAILAAKQIEEWLVRQNQEEGWFVPEPGEGSGEQSETASETGSETDADPGGAVLNAMPDALPNAVSDPAQATSLTSGTSPASNSGASTASPPAPPLVFEQLGVTSDGGVVLPSGVVVRDPNALGGIAIAPQGVTNDIRVTPLP